MKTKKAHQPDGKKRISVFILTPVLFLLFSFSAAAQSRFEAHTLQYGYGKEFSDNVDYRMHMLVTELSRSFNKPRKNDFMGWYGQLQFNLVKATNTPAGKTDVEFGLNLGIRNHIRISRNFYLYQMLGSGPHYISAELDRQANGFIFSDNLAIGSYIHLSSKYFLNLQFGVRHISNANIKLPNRGVNSYIISVGISGIK
jgi:hypothetical protein